MPQAAEFVILSRKRIDIDGAKSARQSVNFHMTHGLGRFPPREPHKHFVSRVAPAGARCSMKLNAGGRAIIVSRKNDEGIHGDFPRNSLRNSGPPASRGRTIAR
jgi:hypothetical protein